MYRVTRLRPLPGQRIENQPRESRISGRAPDTPWKTALEDYLLRCFPVKSGRLSFQAKGSGKSGLIATSRPGRGPLSRTACEIGRNEITARFEVGFPAFGRTINSGELIRD